MSAIWEAMGWIRWPLSFSLLAVVLLALWSAARLFRPAPASDLKTKAWLDAILFWGGFAVIAGVLGTLVGIVVAAQAIEAAGSVSASIVWGGIKIAMLSSMVGILILALAALLWFVLQMRWQLLRAERAEAAA